MALLAWRGLHSRFADAIGNFGIFAATFIFLAQLIKYFAINGENVDAGEAGNNVVDFLVIAISIVVVAVPEVCLCGCVAVCLCAWL